jgi:hypothetical protein
MQKKKLNLNQKDKRSCECAILATLSSWDYRKSFQKGCLQEEKLEENALSLVLLKKFLSKNWNISVWKPAAFFKHESSRTINAKEQYREAPWNSKRPLKNQNYILKKRFWYSSRFSRVWNWTPGPAPVLGFFKNLGLFLVLKWVWLQLTCNAMPRG